jgi:hypothetical protein
MTYRKYFHEGVLKQVNCFACLKVLTCFADKPKWTLQELEFRTGLDPSLFMRTIARLEGKGTIKQVEGLTYSINKPDALIQLSVNHELFDKCKRLQCNCKMVVPKDSLDKMLEVKTPAGHGPTKWARTKTNTQTSPLRVLLNLFYKMVGGQSPSLPREMGILSSLVQKGYSVDDLEIGIRHCAQTGKMFNLGLLPWTMGEALAQRGKLGNLSNVEKAKLLIQKNETTKAESQLGESVVQQAKKIIDCEKCHGSGYVMVGDNTVKRCKCWTEAKAN